MNMVSDAKKEKEHQEVPRAKPAVCSMKMKAIGILHCSLSLWPLENYL